MVPGRSHTGIPRSHSFGNEGRTHSSRVNPERVHPRICPGIATCDNETHAATGGRPRTEWLFTGSASSPGRDLGCRPRVASLAMPIYEIEGVAPRIDADAFVHPDAVVIGDVTIGPESSIWPGAVLRGDYGTITVGARSSIQDGTVVHAGPGFPTVIGDGCVVGHLTHLEGCTLEDESLAGSGSVILHWAVISTGATVGANAVVPNHVVVPPGTLRAGRACQDPRGPIGRGDDPDLWSRVCKQRQAVPGIVAPNRLSNEELPGESAN